MIDGDVPVTVAFPALWQTSPTSPHVGQAFGSVHDVLVGPRYQAPSLLLGFGCVGPTSVSVTASASSCETTAERSDVVEPAQSGMTA